MKKPLLALCTLALIGPPTAQASLVARDLDGNATTVEAYYDTTLGITWMRDRNYLATVTPGMVPTGFVTWAEGDSAVTALNANGSANFGLNGWRMARADGVHTIGGAGCQTGYNGSTDCGSNVDTASSELAFMFHTNLGNLSSRDASGNFRAGSAGIDFGLVNDEDFLNLETGRYWSSTSSFRLIFNVPQNGIVSFDFADGSQAITVPSVNARGFVWLVHDGDVGSAVGNAVPEPAMLALVGLALAAAGVAGRRPD
ncbi:MAG: PEP-CTERM sorting domain-containing protein [Rubrivivax sp.]|nr:PEP-CTERM sorting domain-containing protein [Rubrivivax sp.]